MTSFAGSIGIVGIALILALSNGIQLFINQVQEDTLSTYPLTIMRESQDMSAMLTAMTAVEENNDFNDPTKIYVDDSLGTMMAAMSSTVSNNLDAFKKYIDENYDSIEEYALDADKMNDACKSFIGEHDFACFLASGSEVKDTVREIYSAEVKRVEDKITFTVCGNGFLYNMVRIMVGTLVKVGQGKLTVEEVGDILASKSREKAGFTMPPQGLTLIKVEY